MGFGVGARQTRGWAEVLVGFSGCTDSLDKNGVLSSGGTDCQLIEGQNGASSFNDTGASSFSDTQSTDLQSSKFNVKIAIQVHVQEHMLGFWVQTDCSYCQVVNKSSIVTVILGMVKILGSSVIVPTTTAILSSRPAIFMNLDKRAIDSGGR